MLRQGRAKQTYQKIGPVFAMKEYIQRFLCILKSFSRLDRFADKAITLAFRFEKTATLNLASATSSSYLKTSFALYRRVFRY